MTRSIAVLFKRCSAFIPKNKTTNSGMLLQFTRSMTGYDRNPAPSFFNPDVQQLLKNITKTDYKKIYRSSKLGTKLQSPEYKFMTSEELEKCLAEKKKEAEERLQIPPVVQVQEEVEEVLSEDPALQGVLRYNIVFTDITYGVSDKDRVIVVREPNGRLRKAHWNERFRMNQIYFPRHGRHLSTPHMFEENYLLDILERGDYEFVLDRACLQFEPHDSEYHRVTSLTYDHIEKAQKFDVLQSTRHYGAFVFYLCWHKCIDNFLLHYIQNEEIERAVLLIKLYHHLNPDTKSSTESQDNVSFVQAYIKENSARRSILELAMQSYLDLQKQRDSIEEGIKKAHGL